MTSIGVGRGDTSSAWALVLKIALVFITLDFFLVSINLLGTFQSLTEGHFETTISRLATNPFIGLLLGILATSVFQSSSTTTSLVVGLVAVDFLHIGLEETLQAVIPIIIGANIGTSVTSTLVSIGHIHNRREFYRAFSAATIHDIFNILTVAIFLTLQVMTGFLGKIAWFLAQAFEDVGGLKFTSPLKWLVRPQVKFVESWFEMAGAAYFVITFVTVFLGCFMVRWIMTRRRRDVPTSLLSLVSAGVVASLLTTFQGISPYIYRKEFAIFVLALLVMFSSLFFLVRLMKFIMLGRLEVLFHRYVFKTALRSVVMGVIFTILVQSSSITTAFVVPLAGAGILHIRQIFPFTLGANVGTTITAILAALSTGQIIAVATAFAHLVFNLLGVLLFYFEPMRSIPIYLCRRFAYLASGHRWIPFAYVLLIFFVIPFVCIYLF